MKVMLDSGAYSAFSQGINIDLGEYCTFLHHHAHKFACYVSLDVIPGTYGRRELRPDLIGHAATQSYKNHRRMKDEGLTPVPVVRQGEGFDWLRRYLDDGEGMIAVSVKNNYQAIAWLDDCFTILRNYPDVKVHGLSATSMPILLRYPFCSVDSATWLIQSSRLGEIPVPRYSDGKPNFTLRPRIVSVTDRSYGRSNHEIDLKQFEREHLPGESGEKIMQR